MTPLITTQSLRFSYDVRPVINGISVTFSAGELIALLGPNGSGKSTLIQLLLGHLHGEGEVAWAGKPITQWSRRELAKQIAYLPQSPVFDPSQTVVDALAMGRAPYWAAFGIENSRDMDVVRSVSARLSLDEFAARRMGEISGGQRQRVFLGRCLVQQPRALLLDEPNTFLDLRHQMELCQLLRELTRQQGLCIVMASHDVNLAAAHADRLIVLDNGNLAADGNSHDVLDGDLFTRVFGLAMEKIGRPAGIALMVPKNIPSI